jgi:kinetochore protein Mis12/MTW1
MEETRGLFVVVCIQSSTRVADRMSERVFLMAPTDPQPTNQTTHPLLLPEILGFAPQLLLDDIINIANNAVQDGVNGMEEFLEKWVDARSAREGGDWDPTQEVEQGLVAFQTLLEYHTDIAFDFFEAWSLRNIFAIPPDLPIVMPHQQNLDLTLTAEDEKQALEELEELRAKVDNVRSILVIRVADCYNYL